MVRKEKPSKIHQSRTTISYDIDGVHFPDFNPLDLNLSLFDDASIACEILFSNILEKNHVPDSKIRETLGVFKKNYSWIAGYMAEQKKGKASLITVLGMPMDVNVSGVPESENPYFKNQDYVIAVIEKRFLEMMERSKRHDLKMLDETLGSNRDRSKESLERRIHVVSYAPVNVYRFKEEIQS